MTSALETAGEGFASDETVFALATAPGLAGVAVVRLSGARAMAALCALAGRTEVPEARRLVRASLRDPASGEVIDDGLVVAFPAPASFTGEDVVEFHIHGGRAATAGVIEALSACPGLRPAEPGEFTRRAFGNGKMDLTAAEAIADLVAAETAAQRRQALRQMSGELGHVYDDWRRRLIGAMAQLEATIDFSDEDIPPDLEKSFRLSVASIRAEIAGHLDDRQRGERLRDGLQIAILGEPNVGKSSLLNRLARRDVAIVSDIAGTTRDVIEVRLDLDGYPVTIADTAGIRESSDAVEQEGVRRARARGSNADIKLVVLDAGSWPAVPASLEASIDADTIVVVNKCDLADPSPPLVVRTQPVVPVSVLTGRGLEHLMCLLSGAAKDRCGLGDSVALTRSRHRVALQDCATCLDRFATAGAAELAAEELRLAARALGRITGRVDVEDILDAVFREFCIGK